MRPAVSQPSVKLSLISAWLDGKFQKFTKVFIHKSCSLNWFFLPFSTFEYLSKSSEIVHQSVSLEEAQACQDLLSQAKYHLDRAKSREEQERLFRQRQVRFKSLIQVMMHSNPKVNVGRVHLSPQTLIRSNK